MVSLFILWCASLGYVAAFFAARFAFAALVGIKGRSARLGFDFDAWSGVALGARVAFSAAGPFGCYLVAVACFTLSLANGGELHGDSESMRVSPAPGGSAKAAGIEEGDRIVSIDGEGVTDWDSIRAAVRAHRNQVLPIVVERNGAQLKVRPQVGMDGKIGITVPFERRPVAPVPLIVDDQDEDLLPDDLPCEARDCPSLVDCYVCFTCEKHCHLRDPQACWQGHEDWRLGGPDAAGVLRRPMQLNGNPIGPAKRPRVKH